MAEVSFGEWLKRRRSALGLTQEQLALQLNCSTSALRKFESEERRPSAEVVTQLAEIFNIPQEERKAFLRFTRGDWRAISSRDQEEAPWRVSSIDAETQIESAFPRNNLPLQLTSFIGREKEEAEIKDLIVKNRLVTLIGAGGIGKTRLSIQTSSRLLNEFPNGIWLVELAPLSDPSLLSQAVVNALGLIEQAGRSPINILTNFLQMKRALLILDNCEHLIQACAQLTDELLRSCPDLHILCTSREALSITGETLYHVPTLTTPDLVHSTPEALSQYEAVQLFIERAQSGLPGFSLTQSNALAVANVCLHLDGIPLALELAAARVKGLSVEQIALRLDDRFRLLTSGNRTAVPRHQTLQALIDWSHDLLTEPERMLIRRLSIFAGGWTLEAAEAVCAHDSLESNQILDILLKLVDKSLVLAETQKGESRYHMLETIRQYAREKLWSAGEGDMMRQRHLAYFVDLAEHAEPSLRAFGMIEWLDRLEAEIDNIRAALEWAQESDVESQLRLASALLWFWHIRAHKNEGIDWLERGLFIETAERGDQPATPDRAMIRGKALNASGSMMSMFFDLREASARLEESLTLFQELGPPGKQGMAYAIRGLAGVVFMQGDFVRAGSMTEDSLTLFREIGDKFGIAECLYHLVDKAMRDDDYEQAVRLNEELLALRREIGDLDGFAGALEGLSELAFWQDDYQRAINLIEESLATFREVKNMWAISFIRSSYGDFCFWQGDYEKATKIYEEALAFAQELGDKFFTAVNMKNLGVVVWLRGNYARATNMITNSLAIYRDIGNLWHVASVLHALGDIALAQDDNDNAAQWYEAELALGREVGLEISITFALCGVGKIAWAQGDFELAKERFEEGLRISRESDFKHGILHALYGLGRVAQSQSDYGAARAHYADMLKMKRQRISPLFKWNWLKSYSYIIAYPLEAFGVLAAAQNEMEKGIRLLSAAEKFYTPLRFEMSTREREEHDQAIATARAALGEEAYAKAWEEGKKMSLEEAVAFALEEQSSENQT